MDQKEFKVGETVFCVYNDNLFKGDVTEVISTATNNSYSVEYTLRIAPIGSDEEICVSITSQQCHYLSSSLEELRNKLNTEMDLAKLADSKREKEETSVASASVHHYRMYILVEKHLSTIQKGIQACHALAEYAYQYGEDDDYKKWVTCDNTIVLLDGGNSEQLRDIYIMLSRQDVRVAVFDEPDLNGLTTAVVFLADERVYDTTTYADYDISNVSDYTYTYTCDGKETTFIIPDSYSQEKNWLNYIGGVQNKVKREVLKGKHLAR